MADGAVLRAYDDVDLDLVVNEGVGVVLDAEGVAFGTSHGNVFQAVGDVGCGNPAGDGLFPQGVPGGDLGVAAFLPFLHDARMEG